MRTFLLAIALGLLAPASQALAQQQDALAPAREGQILCSSPNLVRRTCSVLAAYNLRPDGSYSHQAQVLVAQDPVVIMVVSSTVTLRSGAVCGPMTRQNLQAAQFAINGERASPDNAAFLRDQVAQTPGFLGDNICATYAVSPNGLRATYTINGAPSADSTQVRWVRPDEGYRVAP